MDSDHRLPLVPWPSSAVAVEGRMPLDDRTRIVAGPVHERTAAQLADAIARRTGIRPAVADDAPRMGDIVLRIDGANPEVEGYTLIVADRADIAGGDAPGVFYGVQTLLQLVDEDADGWGIRRAEVSDAPRFAYRGVMLDVARHFFGVDDVKAYIDRASALKFNHLHLHLTDDQGWRIRIDSWPLLTERASATSANGGEGGFYTKDDYRAIVAYAAEHRMTVVPEIDLPGHTHAIGIAYPELVEDPVLNDDLIADATRLGQDLPVSGEPYLGWGVGHSSLRIHEERTYAFVADVLRELAELTPGPYLHIGGDESLGTDPADFAAFVERVTAMVFDAGKVPVAWHEVGAAEHIAPGTIGQYWGNTDPQGTHAEEAARFVERGGSLVMSPSNVAYLDMKYSESFPLGLAWAGHVDVRTAYEWEPTDVVPVPDEAILGVEAPLWTETVSTLAEVDQLVFPRIAAEAEVGWSAEAGAERDWESFRERVAGLEPLWQAAGISYHPAPEIPWSA